MAQDQSQNTSQLSEIVNNIPEFFVLKINKVVNKMIAEGKDIIKLNIGKSELPMPQYVEDEFIEKMNDRELREIVNPQGLPELREEIAKTYREKRNAQITAENIFINNGTSPFFLALFLLLTNPGDDILLPLPYYPTYAASANMVRANKTFYHIRDGRIDMEELKANFVPGKTKVVFLNSPGNPLGNVISREELKEILEFVDGRAYIISDEIYDGFVYNNDFTSAFEVYNPKRDKLVVMNGFSKIHHMYTRRLGFAIVPDELIPTLLKFQQYTIVCVDPVTQYGGLVAIKNKEDLIEAEIKDEVQEYAKRLAACEELIASTKLKLIRPEGSFYMCLDVSEYIPDGAATAMELAENILEHAHVAATPGRDFGVDNIFRISLTSSRVVEGIGKMCDYLKTL